MKTVSTIALRRTSLSIYILFIITGVVIGSFIAKYTSLPSYVTVNQFFLLPKDGFNVFQLITGTFITSLCFVTTAFFFGLCAVGQPFELLLLLYRGIGMGISAAAVYMTYGKAGIVTVLITVLPKAVAFSLVTAVAAREGIRSSCAVFSYCFLRKEHDRPQGGVKLFMIKYSFLVLISLFISFADGAVCSFYLSRR